MPEQWARTGNGLYVPERATLAKRMEEAKQAASARGKFFSSMAYTQSSAGPGYTKPSDTMPFEMLRQARDKSLIDKIIIMARITQMKHIAKRVVVPGKQTGFRIVHELNADSNFKPTEEVIRRCKEMERIVANVDSTIHPAGFRDFAAVATDQELTFDRKALVITPDRTGRPIRYHLIDGTTVRSVIEVLLSYKKKKEIKDNGYAIESFYREYNVDLSNAAYVQIVDELPVATWTTEQMSIDITNPSVEINKWAYGAGSALEQSIAASISFMNAWAYNDGLFNQDSPESILFLYGDYDPIGLGAFQRQILDQTGSGDYQKIPIVPADQDFKTELVKLRELPKDIQFAELMRIMIQLKTASYRAHPSIVNFTIDKGSGGGMNIGDNSEDELVQSAHEEGFETLAHGMAEWLTRVLVKPRYDDLVMIFDVDTEDEVKRVELIDKQQKSNMTFNEGRRASGLTGNLLYGDVPDNANYLKSMELHQAKEQQDKMAQMQQQNGGAVPGTPNSGGKDTPPNAGKPNTNKPSANSSAKNPIANEGNQSKSNGKNTRGEVQDPQKVKGQEKDSGASLSKHEGERVLVLEFID